MEILEYKYQITIVKSRHLWDSFLQELAGWAVYQANIPLYRVFHYIDT